MECCNHFTKYDTRNALWAVYFQIVIFYFHKKMIEFKIYQKREEIKRKANTSPRQLVIHLFK